MRKMNLKKEDKGVDQTRNVLVGVSLEKESIQLIGWAIVKVAQPGDHVLALHVCRNSDNSSSEKQILDDYIEIFKHLCHLKKVNLTGKILIGKSIRKTLVREAKHCSAVAVIVGISKLCTIGGWASTGKYCAKNLPSNTQIFTLYNGKVVFKRNSTHDPLESAGLKQMHRIPSGKCQSEFGDSEISELDSNSPTTVIVNQNSFGARSSTDSIGEALEKKSVIVDGTHAITKESNWGRRSVSSLCTVEGQDEAKPGWPLLRRSSIHSQREDKESPRKMSVVQWVMSLPDRSPPESPLSSITDTCSTKSESGFFTSKQRSLSMLSKLLGEEESGITLEPVSSDFTWFSYEALKQATSQFSSENVIGKGGSSQVYKGVLEDGEQVAVKVVKSSKQSRKDFSAEVKIMSSLRHKNITPLLGVCISNEELISVYEFMPNGSLEENLHGKKQKGSLSWETRYRVVIGIAEALVYLHNECSSTVIHRDVKSSNILLSDNFDPQLSDFGLAIWAPKSGSGVEDEVEVVGTFGYMAPEYVMYGKVTDKVDVYSFGVVLLELLSGRKPIIHSCQGQESLVIWAKPMVESGRVVKGLVDPNMEEERWDDAQMKRMVVAASLCLTRDARHRPTMPQILRLLKGEESGETWLGKHVSEQSDKSQVKDINDDNDERLNIVKSSCQVLNTSYEDDFTSSNRVGVELHPCIRLCLADLFKTKI